MVSAGPQLAVPTTCVDEPFYRLAIRGQFRWLGLCKIIERWNKMCSCSSRSWYQVTIPRLGEAEAYRSDMDEIEDPDIRRASNQRGSTLVEYSLLVAFIAVSAIGVLRGLQSVIVNQFTLVHKAMTGSGSIVGVGGEDEGR
jgi:Flp pilus assembly pilin Flp